MSKVYLIPEWFLFMAPTLVSWPPKGEIHQATWSRKSTQVDEFGIWNPKIPGNSSHLPWFSRLLSKFDPRKPSKTSLVYMQHVTGMQQGYCGICISRSMRIRSLRFNDGELWSQAAHQPFNVKLTQVLWAETGLQKISNRSFFKKKKIRKPKKKTTVSFFFFGGGERNFRL